MKTAPRLSLALLALWSGLSGLGLPAAAAPAGPPGPSPVPTCLPSPIFVPPTSGALDRSFGCNGVRITAAADSTAAALIHYNARGAVRLPDDRIVVVGNRRDVNANSGDTLVARYTAGGQLDPSFGTGGLKRINTSSSAFGPETAHGVMVQPDGKLVVVGTRSNEVYQNGYILRLLADGTLDTSFGTAGSGITVLETTRDATDVAGDGSGGFYVSGSLCDGGATPSCTAQLYHLSATGVLDTGFGTAGTLMLSYAGGHETAAAVAVSNGRLAVAGNTSPVFSFTDANLGAARFTLGAGTAAFDTGFSGDGRYSLSLASTGSVHDLLLNSDGTLLIAGASAAAGWPGIDRFSLTRVQPNGLASVRTTTAFPSTARGVMLALARHQLRVYGAGYVETSGGTARLAVAAYTTAGALDTSFSGDGMTELKLGGHVGRAGTAAVVQSGGRIVLVATQEPSPTSGRTIVLVGLVP